MSEPDNIEGPGKGKQFFDRAKTVAESGNFDYAIDMIIEGLRREPQLLPQHIALRNIALSRKMNGGKPAGTIFAPAKGPFKGKASKDQFLNSEWLLAKDPGNIPEMLKFMRAAIQCDYLEVALWFAPVAADANKTTKNPKMDVFIELAAMLEGLQIHGPKKVEALRQALKVLMSAREIKPDDMDLQARERQLAAKITLEQSYGEKSVEDFKESLKNKDETSKLIQEDSLIKSEEYKNKIVAAAKADYEKNPREHQNIQKYGKALADTEIEELETLAIEIYNRAYEETKTYRYKSQADDIRIKQVVRNLRLMREAAKHDPSDTDTLAQVKELEKERLQLELEVFAERVKHYPTEVAYQFEFAKRLYIAKRYAEATSAFQFAQNNPKYRAEALHLLGLCFREQGMKPEATDTLKRAIEEYEYAPTGDARSKTYHYWFARMLEDVGRNKEAVDVYSKIMQWDFAYLDVRARLEKLRQELPPG